MEVPILKLGPYLMASIQSALRDAERFSLAGDRLSIFTGGREEPLRFGAMEASRAPAAEAISRAPPSTISSLNGIWTIVGHHSPGVSATSEAQARARNGESIRLTERVATSSGSSCREPRYATRQVSADAWLASSFQLPPGSLPPLALNQRLASCYSENAPFWTGDKSLDGFGGTADWDAQTGFHEGKSVNADGFSGSANAWVHGHDQGFEDGLDADVEWSQSGSGSAWVSHTGAGSGTTGQAALDEGMRAVLIDNHPVYARDIRRRFGLPGSGVREATSRLASALDELGEALSCESR